MPAPAPHVAVSCASARVCMAVDGTGANTFRGSTWSPAHALGSGSSGPVGVACPSASFCVAVTINGSVNTYNGTSWSTKTAVDPGGLEGVTCASTSFCWRQWRRRPVPHR